jgi:NAD(P)-dependent dehydrogenase (short-subunit alcohol dehydrogenase family)
MILSDLGTGGENYDWECFLARQMRTLCHERRGGEIRKAGADAAAGKPAKLATTYVMLADPLSSYVSGATIAVTGGKPIL